MRTVAMQLSGPHCFLAILQAIPLMMVLIRLLQEEEEEEEQQQQPPPTRLN